VMPAPPSLHVGPVFPVGGATRTAFVTPVGNGLRVVFVTGSGDCQSGCTEHRYDVFLVTASGAGAQACTTDTLPTSPTDDPCGGS